MQSSSESGSTAGNLRRLRWLEKRGEASYDAMYDAHNPTDAAACYSDAKEFFYDAIGLAKRIGAAGDAARLEARLAHVKAVFRSQFT